jgi:hypothetical protein
MIFVGSVNTKNGAHFQYRNEQNLRIIDEEDFGVRCSSFGFGAADALKEVRQHIRKGTAMSMGIP